MKKKVVLSSVLLIVLSLSIFSFASCDLDPPFRPMGNYVSKEYTDPDTKITYRVMINFQETSFVEEISKGTCKYAFQFKNEGDSEWKTKEIHERNLTFKVQIGNYRESFINAPNGRLIKMEYYLPGVDFTASSSSLYKIPLEEHSLSNGTKFFGYTFKGVQEDFPEDITRDNTQNTLTP